MSEIRRGTHLPPGEGESVWLVGDLIEVKLASEDTGGAYSMVEETSPPKADRHRTYTTMWTKRCTSWKGKSRCSSAMSPLGRARGRWPTFPRARCTPSRTWDPRQAGLWPSLARVGSRSSSLRRVSLSQRAPLRPRVRRTWEGSWRSARSTVSKYCHLPGSNPFSQKKASCRKLSFREVTHGPPCRATPKP